MENLISCIICLEVNEESEEHIFPLAIGGKFTIKRVCKTCNANLGNHADTNLTDHPLTVLKRSQLHIPNRDNKVPNMLGKEMKIVSDEFPKLPIHLKKQNGVDTLVAGQTKVEEEEEEGVTHWFLVSSEESDKAKDMGEKWKSRQKKFVQTRPDNSFERNLDLSQIHLEIDEEAIKNIRYERGLLKIAYELTWYWLGENYLIDPRAQFIRKSLLQWDINKEPLLGRITVLPETSSFVEPLHENLHVGAITTGIDNKLYCIVRIFNIFQGVFLMSDQADLYQHNDQSITLDANSGEIIHQEF